MAMSQNRLNPQSDFVKYARYWRVALTMVQPFITAQLPGFTKEAYNSLLKTVETCKKQVNAAGELYKKALDDPKFEDDALKEIKRTNSWLRNQFEQHLRTVHGVLSQEREAFFRNFPSMGIQLKCLNADRAFHDSIFGEKAERGIYSFAIRLNAYHAFVKTLEEAKLEHQDDLKSLDKLRQKEAAGMPIGAKERQQLENYYTRPDIAAQIKREKVAAEIAERNRRAKEEALQLERKKREAFVADLLNV